MDLPKLEDDVELRKMGDVEASSTPHNDATLSVGERIGAYFFHLYLKITASATPHPRDPFPKRTGAYPYPEPWLNYVTCFIGCFTGLSILGYAAHLSKVPWVLGSFGASSVLFYAAPNAVVTQPKNALCGQLIAVLVGITIRNIITDPDWLWLGAALSVSIVTVLTMLFGVIHPPAGATALLSASLPEMPAWSGYSYVLLPVVAGEAVLFSLALLINNVNPYRHYPDRWK